MAKVCPSLTLFWVFCLWLFVGAVVEVVAEEAAVVMGSTLAVAEMNFSFSR